MRVLVTGGAGFLGSRLVDHLVASGASVDALDDLSTGAVKNLEGASSLGRARLVRGDARDRDTVAELVRESDVVFHLAGAVGVRRVADDPVGTWSRNVEGTASVLEACARLGTRCVLASTSEVYGTRVGGILVEDQPVAIEPAARRDVYAVSKLAGESLAIAMHRTSLLPVTVARLFNVVGPRQSDRYGMVMPRFARAAVRGEPLVVHGDGRQTRCFLHVDDAARALVALASSPAAEGAIVNVGSDDEVSIADLARRVVAAAGSESAIRHVSFADVYGAGFVDPPRRRPSLLRLVALTGFSRRLGLDHAIADAIAHARASLAVVPA